MASTSVVDQIVKSLSFEVEAVPQDHVPRHASTSNSTPLNVKIRVRKKDECGMEYGFLSVPKFGRPDANPERIRLISSDQTIMSFDVSMEADFVKKPKRKPRKSFFGGCLGTQYDDDEVPYTPSSAYTAKMTGANTSSKSDGVIRQFTLSKTNYENNNKGLEQYPKKHGILGKCKPGGCLDPPFSEEKYSYEPTTQKRKHKIPSITEDVVKTNTKVKLTKPVDGHRTSKETKQQSKDSLEQKQKAKPDDNTDSIYSLYDNSLKGSLDSKYSDSVITYPPLTSQSGIINEKRSRNRMSSEEKTRRSYNDSIEAFFSSPNKKNCQSSERTSNAAVAPIREKAFIPVPLPIPVSTRTTTDSKSDGSHVARPRDLVLPKETDIASKSNVLSTDNIPVLSENNSKLSNPSYTEDMTNNLNNETVSRLAPIKLSKKAETMLQSSLVGSVKSENFEDTGDKYDNSSNRKPSGENEVMEFSDQQKTASIQIKEDEKGESPASLLDLETQDRDFMDAKFGDGPREKMRNQTLVEPNKDGLGSDVNVLKYYNKQIIRKEDRNSLEGLVTGPIVNPDDQANFSEQPHLVHTPTDYDRKNITLNSENLVEDDLNQLNDMLPNKTTTTLPRSDDRIRRDDDYNDDYNDDENMKEKQINQLNSPLTATLPSSDDRIRRDDDYYDDENMKENQINQLNSPLTTSPRSDDRLRRDDDYYDDENMKENQINQLNSPLINEKKVLRTLDQIWSDNDDTENMKEDQFDQLNRKLPNKMSFSKNDNSIKNESISELTQKITSDAAANRVPGAPSEHNEHSLEDIKYKGIINQSALNEGYNENTELILQEKNLSTDINLYQNNIGGTLLDYENNVANKRTNDDQGVEPIKYKRLSKPVKAEFRETNIDDEDSKILSKPVNAESETTIDDENNDLTLIAEHNQSTPDEQTLVKTESLKIRKLNFNNGNESDHSSSVVAYSLDENYHLKSPIEINKISEGNLMPMGDSIFIDPTNQPSESIRNETDHPKGKHITLEQISTQPGVAAVSESSSKSRFKPDLEGSDSKLIGGRDNAEDGYKASEVLSKSSLRRDSISVDLAFQCYVNDKNERTVKSIDKSLDNARYPDDSITVVQSQLRTGVNEIRIPIDSDNDMIIQIHRTKSPERHVHMEKEPFEFKKPIPILPKKRSGLPDFSNGNKYDNYLHELNEKNSSNEIPTLLNSIYEQELVPLQKTINHLKREIDSLASQQSILIETLVGARRTKPIRLVRVNSRCACFRN